MMNWEKGKSSMKKRSFYLAIAISFIAGTIFWPMALVLLSKLERPGLYQRKKEAYSFFYRTMNELFEGTYNSEEGSVSQDALETFKEYKAWLGGKCRLVIGDDSSGYFGGEAFFPSGDIFYVVIVRKDERMVLERFHPEDWERLWRDLMPQNERDSKQHSE